MRELTARQSEILDFIQSFVAETGMPPTRAEIARKLGFRSVNAAEEHLRALQRKGVISLIPGASRGIQLLDTDHEAGLPLIGRVAAGQPMLASEHIEARYHLDMALFNPRPHYLLRVHGMSMRDAGILDGDLLAVHRTSEARAGQIVVARVHDEVTVKTLARKGHMVELLPANPDFEPIVVDTRSELLEIEGLAVGLIRSDGLG